MRTEDGYIINKCLNGDCDAFGLLVDKYKAGVYALAYSKLGNFHDAEDVAQEVFINVYEKLHTLRRWDRFASWLYRITINLCKMRMRALSGFSEWESIVDSPEILDDHAIESYNEELKLDPIREAVSSLPELHKEAIMLYYFGGMTNFEIAQFSGVSQSAISRRLTKARELLKEELLSTMSAAIDAKKLHAGFTLQVLEKIRHIKPKPPLRDKIVPLGTSIAGALIIIILGMGLSKGLIIGQYAVFASESSGAKGKGNVPVYITDEAEIESGGGKDMLNGKKISAFVTAMTMLAVMSSNIQAEWVKYGDNPVLPSPQPNIAYTQPTVIYDEDESKYKMWFGLSQSGISPPNAWIYYTTSDDGISWDNTPQWSLGPSSGWESQWVDKPFVIKDRDEGIYKMWYSGNPAGAYGAIGYATSHDGVNWAKYDYNMDGNPDPVFTPESAAGFSEVYTGSVFIDENRYDNERYKLYYWGYSGKYDSFGCATSPDGINWSDHGEVFWIGGAGEWDDGEIADPYVIFANGKYKMYYHGYSVASPMIGGYPECKIGSAYSLDGFNWIKCPDNPILPNGNNGDWDDLLVGDPTVILQGSNVKIWYSGHPKTNGWFSQIGYATCSFNQPPIAEAGGPYTANEGSPIIFDGSASTDPDNDPLQYKWSFDDGEHWTDLSSSPNASHIWEDNLSIAINIILEVSDGKLTDTDTASVTINNVLPSVDAGPDVTINEGETFLGLGSFTDPGADTWTATVNYGDNTGNQSLTLNGKTFGLNHLYADNGTYTVIVVVEDDDGGVGTDTVVVTVNNVPPELIIDPIPPISEGESINGTGSIIDPGEDAWTVTVDYGDGSGIQLLELSDKNFQLNHLYGDNGIYAMIVTVADDDDAAGTVTTTVTVNNVIPTVTIAASNATISEGDLWTATGSFTDPGADSWTATVDYGDGSGIMPLTLNADKTFALSHRYLDNPVSLPPYYTVVVYVNDGKDTGISNPVQITVNNVAPSVGDITAPVDPILIGDAIDVSADFTDPGELDTHTASWDWGDESTSDGIVTESDGSGLVTGSHIYSSAGVYTITLTVTDKDNDSGTSTFQYVVIYDPEGGFVTGGGWINSPEGAYTDDPTLTGKATFGFVSKYKKGATVPTGNTQFNFHVANMNFSSTEYEWLVIASAKAQYKGSGTINGTGDYKFMLTAIDGELASDGVDRFRIKIIDKADDSLFYDNQMGDAEDADPETAISGGSIVIHTDKDKDKAAPAMVLDLPATTQLLTAYPNPANPEVWIPYQLSDDTDVTVRIYSISGQLVRTLELGHKQAGLYASKSKSAYWDGKNETGESINSGIYFYNIQAGQYTATGKMLIQK